MKEQRAERVLRKDLRNKLSGFTGRMRERANVSLCVGHRRNYWEPEREREIESAKKRCKDAKILLFYVLFLSLPVQLLCKCLGLEKLFGAFFMLISDAAMKYYLSE